MGAAMFVQELKRCRSREPAIRTERIELFRMRTSRLAKAKGSQRWFVSLDRGLLKDATSNRSNPAWVLLTDEYGIILMVSNQPSLRGSQGFVEMAQIHLSTLLICTQEANILDI